jgi:hypothetical protein
MALSGVLILKDDIPGIGRIVKMVKTMVQQTVSKSELNIYFNAKIP